MVMKPASDIDLDDLDEAAVADPSKPRCHDCNAPAGALHTPGCDVERCPNCGRQLISCPCMMADANVWGSPARRPPDQERLPWIGEWPGLAECREFGFWCRYEDKDGRLVPFMSQAGRWVRCDKDAEGAGEDLNRLYRECRWDRKARRWQQETKSQ